MRAPGEDDLHQAGSDAANEIEKKVADGAQPVLHVCAENPQEPHVADDVKPTSVKKHAGEHGDEGIGQAVMVAGPGELNLCRDQAVHTNKCFGLGWRQGELVNEYDQIYGD